MNRHTTPTERELGLMEAVVTRARDLSYKPTQVELRRRLDWALQDLEAFRAELRPETVMGRRVAKGGTQ